MDVMHKSNILLIPILVIVVMSTLFSCGKSDISGSHEILNNLLINEDTSMHKNRLFDAETPYTLCYQNNDGSASLYIFPLPISYKNGNGDLELIDVSLTSVKDTDYKRRGYVFQTKAGDVKSYYPQKANGEITITKGDTSLLSFAIDCEPSDECQKAIFRDILGRERSSVIYNSSDDCSFECVPTSTGTVVNISFDKEPKTGEVSFYFGNQSIQSISATNNTAVITPNADPSQICAIRSSYLQDASGNVCFNSMIKGSSYNNGNGYKGTGVKIGIMEAGSGQYDPTCPHLNSIPSSRLIVVNEAGVDGAAIASSITDHATIVTSIVVGQAVTIGSTTYEGVVPLSTVYQMPTRTTADATRGFEKLVDRGVTVINYSAGIDYDNDYHAFDKEIDALINETGVSFIVAAGNTGNRVMSPGKALNAVTVGNAETVTSSYTSVYSPYSMRHTTSFAEADYLPNKPDISAPGSYMRVVKTITGSSNFYLSNGVYPSGTSFAAPIVTGIVAQMQQAGVLGFKRWPGLVKSVLATSADSSKIRNSTSSPADSANGLNGTWLWEKSGVGLVNAEKAINLTRSGSKWELSYFFEQGQTGNTSEKYFTAGKRLRVALVFEKINNADISSSNDFDDIDLRLIDPNGNIVASSVSTHDNVIVIDYVIPVSGNYKFRINAFRFVHERFTDLYYYYSWNEY